LDYLRLSPAAKGAGRERRSILAAVQTRREYCHRHPALQRHHHGRMRTTLATVPRKFSEAYELDDKTAKTVPPAMIDRGHAKRRGRFCRSAADNTALADARRDDRRHRHPQLSAFIPDIRDSPIDWPEVQPSSGEAGDQFHFGDEE
jgi:hypothetical protein